jgi:hypothetical protein
MTTTIPLVLSLLLAARILSLWASYSFSKTPGIERGVGRTGQEARSPIVSLVNQKRLMGRYTQVPSVYSPDVS